MKAIVLSCDKYIRLAEHTINSYERLWKDNPFQFHVPYQNYPNFLKEKYGNKIELIPSESDIISTIKALLSDLPDEEWIYWCIDDKYLIDIKTEKVNQIYRWVSSLDAPEICGVSFARSRDLLKAKHLKESDKHINPYGKEIFLERKDYSQIWLHQFLRVKVLRYLFDQFPKDNFAAKEMDLFKDILELPENQKLYVSQENYVVFGESTSRGQITQNCASSFKELGWNCPHAFQVSDESIIIGKIITENRGNISPVFIGGCERSGTSFLASMIGNHPSYITTPECQFKVKLADFLDWSKPCDQKRIQLAIDFMNHHFRFLIWDTLLNEEDYLNSSDQYSLRTLIEHTVQQYAQQHHNKINPLVWFDHDPYNLRDRKIILEHFPDARFIHIVRDGRAVAASVMPLDWGPNTIYHAAHFYKKSVAYGLEAEKELSKHQIMRVRYEDLVENPIKELEVICNWLDIEFNLDMLNAEGFKPPKYTIKQHQAVNQKADPTKLMGWKKKLNKGQIKVFDSIAGELLEELGYERLMPKSTPPNKIRRYIFRKQESHRKKQNQNRMSARKEWGISQLNRATPSIDKIKF